MDTVFEVLVTKRGPILTTELYRKCTNTGRYLHFECNHFYHVERGGSYSQLGQDNQGYMSILEGFQHRKTWNDDLLLNEYPQECTDSIMETGKSNHPSWQSSSHILGISPKNWVILGTFSMLGPFSKLNILSMRN